MLNTAITMNPEAAPDQLLKTVKRAEELNFSTCYIADQGFTLDVFVTLTMLACNTQRIRLGPGVTHPYTRHPVVTAVSVASLDQVSGDRAFLGIGAGGSRSLVPMQIERSKPLQQTREAVEIARQLWSGRRVNYSGEFHSLLNAHIDFPCRPDIEIHWAARGPKMLEMGGAIADVNLLHGIPKFELSKVVASVRAGAEKVRRTPKLQYAAMLVYDAASREVAKARTVFRLVDSTEEVKKILGLTEDKISEIRTLVTTTGSKSAAHLVTDEMLSHYAIEGDVASCASQLRQLVREHGLTGITIEVPDPTDTEDLLAFSAEILARI